MKLNNYAEELRKKNTIIFVRIDQKRKIEEDTIFKMKAETRIMNVRRKRTVFRDDDSVKFSLGLFKPIKCCIRLKTETIWKI